MKLQDFNSEYGFIELDIIAEDLTPVIAGSVFVFKAEFFIPCNAILTKT